jgi:SPP1 gp7 family putative phage head morphogenesis protein
VIVLNPNLSPKEQIDYLQKKGYKLTFNYQEMIGEIHHKAFTVAKVTRLDLLKDIHTSLLKAQKEGLDFNQWKKDIIPTLQKYGWWGQTEVTDPKSGKTKTIDVNSRRLETIFDTNMRTSYSAARFAQIKRSGREYIRYNSILDSKTRPSHSKHHGKIFHIDSDFWKSNYPPNGWKCRCFVTAHTAKELKRNRWEVEKDTKTKIADRDWDYDTRYSSNTHLENIYYQKALNFMKSCKDNNASSNNSKCLGREAFKSALIDLSKTNREVEYKKFVDEVNKDIRYRVNQVVVGTISLKVFDFLAKKDIEVQTPHIYLTKKSFAHMTREAKDSRGASLSVEEIKEFASVINEPEMILWDESHKNILYVFDAKDSKKNKIVVEVNYKNKKDIVNMIVTSGKVEIENLLKNKNITIIE